MSLVRHTDKRSGVTYVYESESYWDKEKQQPRSKRKLIGKVDPVTGEIVPTGKSGRKPYKQEGVPSDKEPITEQIAMLAEKDKTITELKSRIRQLEKEKQDMISDFEALLKKWS